MRGGGAGFDPVGWKERFELPGGRVVHQFFKHPFEVGEGICPVAADLLYEGVEDRAAPAGVFAADEHPVLVPKFGGADGIFGEVVVELDLSVEETRLEVWPLALRRISDGWRNISPWLPRRCPGLAQDIVHRVDEFLHGLGGFVAHVGDAEGEAFDFAVAAVDDEAVLGLEALDEGRLIEAGWRVEAAK